MLLAMMAMKLCAQTIITDTPEGTRKSYNRVGKTYNTNTGKIEGISSKFMDVVYGDDGKTVYIQNPISGFMTNTWIKGTIDGNTITVPTGQTVYYMQEYNASFKIFIMEKVSDDPVDFAVDETTSNFTYTIDGKDLKLNGTNSDGSVILGVAAEIPEQGSAWGGTGDFDVTCTEVEEKPVAIPEGLATTDYKMTGDGSAPVSGIVKVARDGNDVYFQGIYTMYPEGTIKGTIDSNGLVTFKKGQFMGTVLIFQTYLVGSSNAVTPEDDDAPLTDVVFEYDAANDRYTLKTTSLIFNDNPDELSLLDYYNSCVLSNETSGIRDAQKSSAAKVTYYDLSGQRVSSPAKGFVIRKTENTDGSVTTSKLLVK
ncbi:hypothetical protein JCM15908A_03250 [Prevotella dentasini JCM 15908]